MNILAKWMEKWKWRKMATHPMSMFFKDEERFKKLKRNEFKDIKDEKLIHAAISWVFGKTQIVKPEKHLDVLATLPMPCQYLIAVNAIDGEVNNGGFWQYYFNESHILTAKADEALLAIGAPKLAEVARKADYVYSQLKRGFEKYRDIELGVMEEFLDHVDHFEDDPLDVYDTEYYDVSETEKVEELLIHFIRKNIDCFGD
jgi:hypothetical protein